MVELLSTTTCETQPCDSTTTLYDDDIGWPLRADSTKHKEYTLYLEDLPAYLADNKYA